MVAFNACRCQEMFAVMAAVACVVQNQGQQVACDTLAAIRSMHANIHPTLGAKLETMAAPTCADGDDQHTD